MTSRYLRQAYDWKIDAGSPAASVEFLLSLASGLASRPVLFPTDDETSMFVAENATQLQAGFLFPALPARRGGHPHRQAAAARAVRAARHSLTPDPGAARIPGRGGNVRPNRDLPRDAQGAGAVGALSPDQHRDGQARGRTAHQLRPHEPGNAGDASWFRSSSPVGAKHGRAAATSALDKSSWGSTRVASGATFPSAPGRPHSGCACPIPRWRRTFGAWAPASGIGGPSTWTFATTAGTGCTSFWMSTPAWARGFACSRTTAAWTSRACSTSTSRANHGMPGRRHRGGHDWWRPTTSPPRPGRSKTARSRSATGCARCAPSTRRPIGRATTPVRSSGRWPNSDVGREHGRGSVVPGAAERARP